MSAIVKIRKAPRAAVWSVFEVEHRQQTLLAAFHTLKSANAFALLRRALLEKEAR
jgi:hypothetical protein